METPFAAIPVGEPVPGVARGPATSRIQSAIAGAPAVSLRPGSGGRNGVAEEGRGPAETPSTN